jgi:hypothetical protein
MHAEDVPVIFGFAAEHHVATGGLNGRVVNARFKVVNSSRRGADKLFTTL